MHYTTSDAKDLYHRHYVEASDLASEAIRDRFDQDGYNAYKSLQDVLLKAAGDLPYDPELKAVLDFYGDDFDLTAAFDHTF